MLYEAEIPLLAVLTGVIMFLYTKTIEMNDNTL